MKTFIMRAFLIKNLKRILFLLSVVITIMVGALIGIVLVYQRGFPQIESLEDIRPKVMTVIHDDRENPIKEFAAEKRKIIRRRDIPDYLEKALVVSEDPQFYSHWGINFRGTLRAIFGELTNRNLGGGSSITQQLALNFFLTRKRTWARKFKEMLMAIQIEKKYSKDQILTFYCNKIFLGGNVYGVEAASRYYFGKSVKDINLAEAALFPAIMPNPNGRYNVFTKPGNCLRKRKGILERMLENGFITGEQYREAVKHPLPEKPFDMEEEEIGNYFVEETRKLIEARYGGNALYTGGLKVYTTLNSELQIWAEDALRKGVRAVDKRRGWRGNLKKVGETVDLDSYRLPSWKRQKIEVGNIVEGIVLTVNKHRAIVKVGDLKGTLDASAAKWTRLPLERILERGDIVLAGITAAALDKTRDEKTRGEGLELKLEQEPEVQGAILVVDNKTGEIKSMVGGYNFKKSQWNHATQAQRQTGSTIKPIVYTAAVENGYTPSTIIIDEPVIFDNQWTQEPYEPQNYTEDFKGPLTMRRGFEQSRNIISTKIVEYLTPPRIVQYAGDFGVTADLKPYMSIALGAFEVKLIEMVSAYTVFPNLGVRVKPFLIRKIVDNNNNIIEENYPDRKRVVEPEVAYITNNLMQGVVKSGTAKAARHLEAPIGGKTGTTDDYTDAWFIGFSPSITVGIWVGLEMKEELGDDETGGRTAVPIFIDFMEKYLEKYPEPHEFKRPPGIIMRKIDKYTGKLCTDECLYPFREVYIRGTEPLERCTEEDHKKIIDYYHDESIEE